MMLYVHIAYVNTDTVKRNLRLVLGTRFGRVLVHNMVITFASKLGA